MFPNGVGAAHAIRVQAQMAFTVLIKGFHTPTPRVHTENRPRARLGEIGHEDFYALRAIVTPFFGKDNRDIAQIMERRAAGKDPVVTAAPIRFVTGAAVVTALREVLHQVPEM